MCYWVTAEAQGHEESWGWRNQGDELGAVVMWEAVAEETGMDWEHPSGDLGAWDELGAVLVWEAVAEEGKELLTKVSPEQWFCFSCPFSPVLSTNSFTGAQLCCLASRASSESVSQECGPCFPLGGVDPVDLAGPAPHRINMCLEKLTKHPAFSDLNHSN